MTYLLAHIGMISGALSFYAYLLYVFSVIKGETRPSRSTWWILTLVGGLIFWSSYALGARDSYWIQLSYVVGPLMIAVLSLKHGEGETVTTLDKICFTGALGASLLWVLFNSPLIGLLGSIVVDFIGLVPTLRKSFLKPDEESPNAWLLETIASLMNLLSVAVWFSLEDKSWIYALYLATINGLITLFLWRKRIASYVAGK